MAVTTSQVPATKRGCCGEYSQGRADRAFRNLLETFPVLAALALAPVVTGRNGSLGALGAAARVVTHRLYVPLYFFQLPFARSLLWFVSIFVPVAVLVRLFH